MNLDDISTEVLASALRERGRIVMPENWADELVLTPMPVEREPLGHWWHPGFPWVLLPPDSDLRPILTAMRLEISTAVMEVDAPDLFERYSEANNADCSAWIPRPPIGDGWIALCIVDTEDGPCASWVRYIT